MIWNRPFLSVSAVLEMLPWYDVAVMRAPEMGSVSGPVTRPRMMSVDCCAKEREGAASRAPAASTSRARRGIFTRTAYGFGFEKLPGVRWHRRQLSTGGHYRACSRRCGANERHCARLADPKP